MIVVISDASEDQGACLLYTSFYDVKHMDDETHRDITGASNEKILSNLAALAKVHHNIVVRLSLIHI